MVFDKVMADRLKKSFKKEPRKLKKEEPLDQETFEECRQFGFELAKCYTGEGRLPKEILENDMRQLIQPLDYGSPYNFWDLIYHKAHIAIEQNSELSIPRSVSKEFIVGGSNNRLKGYAILSGMTAISLWRNNNVIKYP